MLHTEAVEKGTLDLIKRLMNDQKFQAFNLVGGTALALKIGHRKSIDIDLFTTKDFDAHDLSFYMASAYKATRVKTINNGTFCFVDGIKIDLLAHQYPLLEDVEVIEGVRMASIRDIGAMKLNAIYGNGSRIKDFVDIYVLLEYFSLQELLEACEMKYPNNSIVMTRNALVHFDDIDFTVPIDYIGTSIKWTEISS